MENKSLFDSKYDNEFIGLLNEIGIRLNKFDKIETLKIKSWINILMIPCKNNIDKKNRNLYAILLINQMVNGRLEEPFIKFANSANDLQQLSPANIKAELSRKFYDEIDFEKIENFGYSKQKEFILNHPSLAEKIQEKKIKEKKQNQNNKIVTDYTRVNNIIDYNVFNSEFKSRKAFFNRPYSSYKPQKYDTLMEFDINNLYSIIKDLEIKIAERDNIIEQQNDKIDELKKIMNNLEKNLK